MMYCILLNMLLGLHRSDHRFAMGSRSHTEATSRGHAVEPEWFTRGPSSRADVIELRGFGMRSDDGDVESEKSETSKVSNVAGSGDSIQRKTEVGMEKENSYARIKRNATSACKNLYFHFPIIRVYFLLFSDF